MSGETELRRLLARQGLRRREFIEAAAALGAGTALATSLAGRAFAQSPQKGGHLKLGIDSAGATDSLDPATYTAWYMQVVGFSGATAWSSSTRTSARCPSSPRAGSPTTTPPSGCSSSGRASPFSNGKEMTAADVVYSINHHRGEGSKSGRPGYLTGHQGREGDGSRRGHVRRSTAPTPTCPTSCPTTT